MKIVETTFERLPRERLEIGFEGENQRATVRIDCASVFAEYPNATPALIVKPLFADAYPVVVDRNGTCVDWLITSEILSFSGDGEIQLIFYKDQVICKSAVSKIRVSRSLTVTGEMPDPVVQWIENANRKLAEVDAQIVELEGMVDTATDAATRAEQSASTASTKAEQAAGSAATATAKANEATQAAGTATAKAAEAALSATQASNSAVSAANSESGATAKAAEAAQSAQTAAQKAEQITEAAQIATGKAEEASASATAAQTSATNAASSATAAQASQTAAKASETAAETSATQAAQSAQNASTVAQTATQKAAEATQSATNAAASATNAATSAETASTKAGEAAQSAQAVEQTAEQLAESLEQIEQNKQDIAELDERKANIDGYYPDMTVGNAEQLNSSKFVENSEPYTFRTSGGTSDIGNREYLDAVVGGSLAWNQMVRDEASENSTDFAPIVTVTDAVEDAAGVTAQIKPVQDLHGYDNPWPAGGGKNKFKTTLTGSRTLNGVTFTADSDGNIVANGTATALTDCDIGTFDFDGIYFLSGCPQGGSTSTYLLWTIGFIGYADVGSGKEQTTVSGIRTLGIRIAEGVTVNNLVFKPMLCLASEQDKSFAPYSNICPITGWDGVQVWDDPKHGGLIEWNQLVINGNYESEYNIFELNGTLSVIDNVGLVTPNGQYSSTLHYGIRMEMISGGLVTGHKCFIKVDVKSTKADKFRMRVSDGMVWSSSAPANTWTPISAIITVETYNTLCTIYANDDTLYTTDDKLSFKQCMVIDLTAMFGAGNEPSTVEEFKALFPADYYPYNEGEITTVSAVNGNPYRHYSITLPTEAGTVYGGELTVNADGSGSLVVDRATRTLDGTEPGWAINGSFDNPKRTYGYNKNSSMGEILTTTEIVSSYVPSAIFKGNDEVEGIYVEAGYLWIRTAPMQGMTAVVNWTTYLSNNPLQVVYKLTTPITYTLTASQIRTLLGENNVWADTGDLALTYTGTDEHLVLESGKKYLARLSGTDSMLLGSGQEITAVKGQDNVFDLTQMFGTAVADYVYGQGAAFFRKWFPGARYPYNAGELKHVEGLSAHEMVGFNQWDEEWEVGEINNQGEFSTSARTLRVVSKNYIPVISSELYYCYFPKSVGNFNRVFYYDKEKQFLSYENVSSANTITVPSNAAFIKFHLTSNYGTTYKNDICINLSHNGSRNGEYEPYEKHSYPLDSTVILRGIPKVGANGVYWDGDRYLPEGTIERRYGVVDLGTVNWLYRNSLFDGSLPNGKLTSTREGGILAVCSKYTVFPLHWSSLADGQACVGSGYVNSSTCSIVVKDSAYTDAASFKSAMQGVLLVYELATPTTETAQPYHSTQWVSDWGTEEFVSTGIVPVGSETRYPANLRDKLQHLPDAASGNGSYLITQTDGQMVLTPFPAPPSSAGNYVLKATVVNGVATYTWEVAT